MARINAGHLFFITQSGDCLALGEKLSLVTKT
jgi:hypothetical protein